MPFKGYNQTEEHKEKLRLTRFGKNNGMFGVHRYGELNPNWKGNNIGYAGLHSWLRKRIQKPNPNICPCCEERPTRELANYTGIYNKDFDNWVYLCSKCHKKLDVNTRYPK